LIYNKKQSTPKAPQQKEKRSQTAIADKCTMFEGDENR